MREGWEYKKLGEVATYVNGFAFKPEQWTDEGMPIVRIQNLNNPSAPYNYCTEKLSDQYLIKKGDILISWSASLGAYEWQQDDAYLNQHIFKVVFDKLPIDKYYLKYAVESRLEDMKKQVHGATMQHITKKNFDNILIPYPEVSTQQQIVSELDLLSHIIDQKRQQLKEYDALAESIFYNMFGDPVENPKGWEVKKLGDLFKVTSSKRILQNEWTDTGVPFLKVADLVSIIDGEKQIPSTFIPEDIYMKLIEDGNVPKVDDILITSRGTIGQCYIVKEQDRFYFQDGMITWLANNCGLVVPTYIVKLLGNKAFQKKLTGSVNKSTVSYISIGQLSKKEVPLPPLPLQRQFAAKIESIEQQKQLLKESIKETEMLFQSRMDYWFNG